MLTIRVTDLHFPGPLLGLASARTLPLKTPPPLSFTHPYLLTPCQTTLEGHLLLDLGNRQTGVQSLGAGPCAVQNGVASVEAHRVVQCGLALGLPLVTGVGQPSVRLKQDGGS